VAKEIIAKQSCPACGWSNLQTKNYGMKSLFYYLCPDCGNKDLGFKPTTRKKENEAEHASFQKEFEKKKKRMGFKEMEDETQGGDEHDKEDSDMEDSSG